MCKGGEGMNELICKCGHGIDWHDETACFWNGNPKCRCSYGNVQVAEYAYGVIIAERDALRKQVEDALEVIDFTQKQLDVDFDGIPGEVLRSFSAALRDAKVKIERLGKEVKG
jgi:hypothetical protein